METNKKGFRTALCIFVSMLLCSCDPITNVKYTPASPPFPPYTGKVAVFWKEDGIPIDPNTYDLIGTISGQSGWCGVNKAKFSTDFHNYLINEAGKYGGDGIILYCGELGSLGKYFCYGDIIRFRK